MRDRDGGSALLLMPAAVLVMVVLGAFAVDAAVVFLAEREVANLAAGIANDIAGAALDREDFYAGSGDRDVRIDPDRAREVLELSLGAYRPDHLRDVRPLALSYPAEDEVAVRIGASVDYLFSSALPGAADGADVDATATAAARQE